MTPDSAAWPPGAEDPVRFDHFVERALYDDVHGFYGAGGGAGRRGDFLTSVEVGPLFGAVLARALDRWWDDLGRPDPYRVVDAGAGAGTLARAVLAAAPGCADALELTMLERSPALRARHPTGPHLRSAVDLPDGPFRGVIVANELLDNLPFRVVERTESGWREQWVHAGAVRWEPVADLADVARLAQLDVPVGSRVPYQAAAAAWVSGALARLGAGRLVVIDYADTTAAMAARGDARWLRTYRAHQRGGPPQCDPGEQDVTSEVALDQLPVGATTSTQVDFLRRWGIDELVEEGRQVWQARAHLGDLLALRGRSRAREAEALLDPDGLGAFTVAEWAVG